MNGTQERVLRALDGGPLYRPFLCLLLDLPDAQVGAALRALQADGKVEVAKDIGPLTYRRTNPPEGGG